LRLKNALLFEPVRVCRADLRQRAVTLARIRARVGEPVLRFVRCANEALVRHLSVQGRKEQTQHECGEPRVSRHGCLEPFNVRRYATMSSNSEGSSLPLYEGIAEAVEIVYSRRSAFTSDTRRSSASISCTV